MNSPSRFIRARSACVGLAALVASSIAFPMPSAADTVHLRDGSLIHGTVTSIDGATVAVKTVFAGDLHVLLKEITGITTDGEQAVTLKGGGVYTGRMQLVDGQQQILQKDGPAVIDVAGLAKVVPVPPADAPKPPANWTGRLELALKGDRGNSNNLEAAVGITTTRTDALNRLTLTLRGQFEESDNVIDKNEAFGQLHYERDLSERLFFFTRLDLEYDKFESVDLRSRLAAGLGRFLIRTPRQDLKILGAFGYEYERFNDGSTVGTPLTGGGYIYRLAVRDWLRLDSMMISYVSLTDIGDWRLDADNAAEVPLSNKEKWKLRLGVRNEFDAKPLPGIDSLDTNFYLSLVYAWD
jgi:putative salt-induced outer membrane protein YdiY